MTEEKKTILTWIDLETTGLNEDEGNILEYAVVFTDSELNELRAVEGVVKQDLAMAIELMDGYVVKMHTQNGLLDELKMLEAKMDGDYDDALRLCSFGICSRMQGIEAQFLDNKIVFVAAGSNVLFDIKWIIRHMPGVAEKLDHRGRIEGSESYRCLDVSNYKVGFPKIFGKAANATHRAMDDIRFSIEQHRKMRNIVNHGVELLIDRGDRNVFLGK
jgi:oligoribonuclease